MMETSTRNKWQIRLAVLLIFVMGFVAGALTLNVYRAHQTTSAPPSGRHGRFERVMDQLDLNDEQRDQVKKIFDEARSQLVEMRKESEPKFRQVREQTNSRLHDVLTPEQWDQFQKLTAEDREHRSHRNRRQAEP
jgi:Spy/CpxP family protein refolding chaperone